MKRRAEAAAVASATAQIESESMTAGTTGIPPTQQPEEPPHKKFKPLFDATAPTAEELVRFKKSLADPNLDVEAIVNGSQTQTQTQGVGRAGRTMGVSTMEILREEEEETQAGETAPRELRGAKRARVDLMEESGAGLGVGMEMEVEAGSSRSRSRAASITSLSTIAGASAAKRRAVENVNAVQRTVDAEPVAGQAAAGPAKKPASTTFNSRDERNKAEEREKEAEKGKGKQVSSSKMDTDDAFLTAIASRKRGKKTEDEFDRDFNKLKIPKPELDKDRRDPEEEWAVLKEFGDDSDVRGNFMVIVDLEPYKRDEAAIEAQRQKNWNPDWDGRENHKKFKQVGSSYFFDMFNVGK